MSITCQSQHLLPLYYAPPVRRPCARQKPIRDKIDKSSSPPPSLHLPPAATFKVPLRLRLRGEEFTPTFMYVLFSEANRHKFPWRASCRCSSLRLLSQTLSPLLLPDFKIYLSFYNGGKCLLLRRGSMLCHFL